MKLVRENILFEKFEEHSDPIEDMGIDAIPLKEARKLAKNLKQKLEEIFPNQEAKIKMEDNTRHHENIYLVNVRLVPSGFGFDYITFCGSKEAARVYINYTRSINKSTDHLEEIIGWYVTNYTYSKISQAKTEDYDKLIDILIKGLQYNQSNLDYYIADHEKTLKRIERKYIKEKAFIETYKNIKDYLK
jgi:hypothetical protein